MGQPVVDDARRYTVAEYFRIDHDAVDKHEYRAGQVLAMAGGTAAHSLIIANVIREAGNQLEGSPCRVYDSNLRVAVNPGTRYAFPDASVIRGPVEYDPADDRGQTATNPRVLVEVLSSSTEGYDRGEKFRRYLRIGTFEEYVLVSQALPVIETYTRQPDGTWAFRWYDGIGATARLQSLGIGLRLNKVFAGVEFPSPEPGPAGGGQPPATGGGPHEDVAPQIREANAGSSLPRGRTLDGNMRTWAYPPPPRQRPAA